MEPIELRPLSFGEVLDTSFNLFKRNFKSAVITSAVIMIPLTVLGSLAAAGLAPSDLSALEDPNVSPEEVLSLMGGLFGAIGVGALLQMVGSVLVQAATTRIYSENYRGVKVEAKDALRYGLSRMLAMVGLTILTSIGTFLGFLFCIIPGVWLYGMWGLAPASLIAEKSGPITALKRSFNLVKGSWWRVFGILVLTSLIATVITSVIVTPIQLAFTFGSGFADPAAATLSSGYLAANALIQGLVSTVTLPFIAAVVVALYYDQRVRKEGYDLERLIADLGEPPATHTEISTDSDDPFGLG